MPAPVSTVKAIPSVINLNTINLDDEGTPWDGEG